MSSIVLVDSKPALGETQNAANSAIFCHSPGCSKTTAITQVAGWGVLEAASGSLTIAGAGVAEAADWGQDDCRAGGRRKLGTRCRCQVDPSRPEGISLAASGLVGSLLTSTPGAY